MNYGAVDAAEALNGEEGIVTCRAFSHLYISFHFRLPESGISPVLPLASKTSLDPLTRLDNVMGCDGMLGDVKNYESSHT